MKSRVLVIAPHPDDETLGCGGTLLKHKDNKDDIYWLIITQATDKNKWGERKIIDRKKEIEKVANAYNFSDVINLGIETTKVSEYPFGKLVEDLEKCITRIKPNIIYIHNHSDVHSDHRISFKAFISAAKSFKHPYVNKILMYETLSETNFTPPFTENQFTPNFYVDITPYIDRKIQIMEIYESEIREHPFPRSRESIKALAILRGSEYNCNYAEAFMLIRGIWR